MNSTFKHLFKETNRMTKKQEILFIICFYSLFVLLFFIVLKLFGCGYHLVDDKDFLYFNGLIKINGETLSEATTDAMAIDLSYRFRPLWWIMRFYTGILFGINLIPHSILRAIQLALTMIIMHASARRRGHSFFSTLLFVLISLVGYQSCNWWKLGTPEMRECLFLAAGFWLFLKWLDENSKIHLILGFLVLFVMILSKENFILTIPFFMIYIVYDKLCRERNNGHPITWRSIRSAILGHWHVQIILGLMFVLPILYILTHLSTDDYTVSGGGLSQLSQYIEINRTALQTDLKWFVRFSVFFVAIMLTFWEQLKDRWLEILVMLSFVLPQIAIYFSTGITERYILPVSIGYAYFFVLVALKKGFMKGPRRYLYIAGILLLLLAHSRVAIREADYFRWRGNSVQTALDTVVKLSEDNPDLTVLSALNPNVEADDTLIYNQLLHGFDNTYVWKYDEQSIVGSQLGYYDAGYCDDKTCSIYDVNLIVAYNRDDRHWCHDIETELDLSDFDTYTCGTLNIYIRKDTIKDIPEIYVQGLRFNF